MIRLSTMLLCLLTSVALTAAEQSVYVVPVATAHFTERIYTTTLALRNDSQQDVTCESIYAVPNDPKGGTLRAALTIPSGGRPQIQEDVLMEAGAIGTIRLVCSAKLAIAARIQVSTDGGATFDDGRTYPGLDEASAFRRLRTVTARSDLLVAEVAGKPITFEAIVKNDAGGVIGHKTYEIPGFAQQIVNLSKLFGGSATLRVELRVTSGEGALIVGEETHDSALLAMAARMPAESHAFEQRESKEEAASQVASSDSNIAGQLLTSSFKAAPFQDPFTGLVLMRDRWYDRTTGTFLTPDPEGYGDSSNLYVGFAGDPVNGRDPTGRCLGLDKAGLPCSYYAKKLPDFLVESMGINQIPGTGIKKLDSAIRKATEAPLRLSVMPAEALLSTGDSTGEYLYRMERSTFHGEMPIDPENVDDQLLLLGVTGDVATFIAPFELLKGDAPSLVGSRESQRGSFIVKGRKKGPGTFVAKNESMSPEAAAYQDAVANGQPGQVYRVPYENPNPRGRPHVDFDGVQGSFAVDTKLSVVTRPKTVGQAARQAESLRQSGARGIWKVPNVSEALRARAMIQQANAGDVLSVIVER